MLVKLRYFRYSGKWYSDGEYETNCKELYHIWDEILDKMNGSKLPGLIEGHDDCIVLVDVPDHPHNHPTLLGV